MIWLWGVRSAGAWRRSNGGGLGSRWYVELKTTSPGTLGRKGQIAGESGLWYWESRTRSLKLEESLFVCNVAAQSGSHMSSCASALAIHKPPGLGSNMKATKPHGTIACT
ncbi:hypothetical protein IG631_02580 [Alternaria alternata]|nr:hypothetical protein IG631_02580 [Alternaria alternata]